MAGNDFAHVEIEVKRGICHTQVEGNGEKLFDCLSGFCRQLAELMIGSGLDEYTTMKILTQSTLAGIRAASSQKKARGDIQ